MSWSNSTPSSSSTSTCFFNTKTGPTAHTGNGGEKQRCFEEMLMVKWNSAVFSVINIIYDIVWPGLSSKKLMADFRKTSTQTLFGAKPLVKYKLRRKQKISGLFYHLKSLLLYALFDVSSEELIHVKIKGVSTWLQ